MDSMLARCTSFMTCAILVASGVRAEAARPRRPSSAQIKQMQEQAKYMQQDTLRYQTEVAAKLREIYLSFDRNGNQHLEGGEKARYDSYMHAVAKGTEPNPLATIAPIGKGPKDATTDAKATTGGSASK